MAVVAGGGGGSRKVKPSKTPLPKAKAAASPSRPKLKPKKFFNPELQAMYDSLMIDLNSAPVEQASSPFINMGEIPEFTNARAVVAEAKKKSGGKPLSKELASLQRQIQKADYRTQQMGSKTPKKNEPSLLERVIDVLSRGTYASANAFQDNMERGKQTGENPFDRHRLGAGVKGFWEGLSGQEKTTFGKLRQDAGVDHGKWGNFAQDIFFDIFADPTTYLTLGTSVGLKVGGKAVTRGGRKTQEAQRIVREARKRDEFITRALKGSAVLKNPSTPWAVTRADAKGNVGAAIPNQAPARFDEGAVRANIPEQITPESVAQQAGKPEVKSVRGGKKEAAKQGRDYDGSVIPFKVDNQRIVISSDVRSVPEKLAETLKQTPLDAIGLANVRASVPSDVALKLNSYKLSPEQAEGLAKVIDDEALEKARELLNVKRAGQSAKTGGVAKQVDAKKLGYTPRAIAKGDDAGGVEKGIASEVGEAAEKTAPPVIPGGGDINIGRRYTDEQIRAMPEYKQAVAQTTAVQRARAFRNETMARAETDALVAARQARYQEQAARIAAKPGIQLEEAYPVQGLDAIPVEMRINAEDEIIAEFERKSKGKQLFHNLSEDARKALMAAKKPEYLEKALKAAGYKPPALTATARVITSENMTRADELMTQASDLVEKMQNPGAKAVVDAVPPASAPKPAISQHAAKSKSSKPQYNGKPYDEPLTPRELEIAGEVARHLRTQIDVNQFQARYANNIQKLLGARHSIVGRLLADRPKATRARAVGTEGLKLRSLQILKAVEAELDTVFVTTPGGVPIRLIDQLERIPAKELMELNTVEAVLNHTGSVAATHSNMMTDQVIQTLANEATSSRAVAEMAEAAPEAAGRATLIDTGSVKAADAAEKITAKNVDEALEAADPAWRIGNITMKARAGDLDETFDVQKVAEAQQRASFEYLGIKIGWGVNPLLEIPVIPIGSKSKKALKKAQKAQQAAAAERNYDQNFNSLLEAVKAAPRALAMAFNNAYGVSPKLHETRVSAEANLANRLAQSATSIGLFTRQYDEVQKRAALEFAQNGQRGADDEINKLADLYDEYISRLLDTSNPGSVINRAGIMDPKRIQYELARSRPRPGADPLKIGDDLNWKDIPLPVGMDVNHVVMAIETAVQKAVVKKMQADQIVVLFGTRLGEQTISHAARGYSGTGRYLKTVDSQGKPMKLPPEFSGVRFPNEIAEQLEFLYKKLDEIETSRGKGPNPILRGFDIVLGKWKAGVTIYNPAFHIRNAMGDMFTGALDGVGPTHYRTGARILSRHSAKRAEEIPEHYRLAGGYDSREVFRYIAPERKGTDPTVADWVIRATEKPIVDIKGTQIGADEFMSEYLQRGLRQNIAASEMLTQANQGQGILNKVGRKGRAASEYREDFFRMAHFVKAVEEGLKKGLTKDEAFALGARRSKKYHADYSDLTEFERNVMRRVIPFYTWQRRMMPVILENVLTRPGAMVIPSKIMRDFSAASGQPVYDENKSFPQVEQIVPEWMRQGVLWPVGRNPEGNMMYADPGNPFHDIFRQNLNQLNPAAGPNFQPIKTFMQQTNPLIRMPLETTTGRQFFGSGQGIPIREGEENLYYDQQLPILSILSRITNISPSGTIGSLAPGGDTPQVKRNQRADAPDEAGINMTQLINTLTAAGMQENTEDRQKGELRRQQDISDTAKKKALEEYYRKRGKTPPVRRNY